MLVILWAFTLFHVAVGIACLTAAVRLLTPQERQLWRSPLALLTAELLCWIYPIAAFAADAVRGDMSRRTRSDLRGPRMFAEPMGVFQDRRGAGFSSICGRPAGPAPAGGLSTVC